MSRVWSGCEDRENGEMIIKIIHGHIMFQEINDFRGMLGGLFNYDWISVPLVYTQVSAL